MVTTTSVSAAPAAINCYRVARFWQKASVAELSAGGAVRASRRAALNDWSQTRS
jgi:hypothetical protein